MIVTVTMNPALDKTAYLDKKLCPGGLNRISSMSVGAGGKGINVSRMVAELGGGTYATGFAGSAADNGFPGHLSELGLEHGFVEVCGTTRENLKVIDPYGELTEINQPGLPVSNEEYGLLLKKLLEFDEPGTIFVLSGSLPPGVPHTAYRDLTVLLHRQKNGASVFVDADGGAFRAAMEAPPDFVKPNHSELTEYFECEVPVEDTKALAALCVRLVDAGVGLAALSLGERGAIFATSGVIMLAHGLPVDIKSPVGAGDCMVGALAFAMDTGMELEEAIVLAVAASAGAVTTPGTGIPDRALIERLKPLVRLERL